MPNATVMLSNITQSVLRPVVLDIVRQLQNFTGIGDGVEIYYPDTGTVNLSAGSSIDDDDTRLPRLSSKRRVMIEVEEDHDAQEVLSTAVRRYEQHPVWADTRLGVRVCPVYSTTKVSINYRFITHSREEAVRWRNDIRTSVSMGREYNTHDVSYSYPLHTAVLELIAQVYINREEVAGYGDSLEDYLLNHGTPRLRLIGATDGKKARLAVAEKQGRILGYYNFEGVPEQISKEDGGVYAISFSYNFSFDKPIALHLKYPVIIHNQLLPPEYTTFTNKQYKPEYTDKDFRQSLTHLWNFETDHGLEVALGMEQMVRLPAFDDFLIVQQVPHTLTTLLALTTVGEDGCHLLNLSELGDAYILPSVLRFIQEVEYQYIHKPYKSVLNISLYRDGYLGGLDSVRVDEHLDVYCNPKADLRRQHRVRISIVKDWSLVDDDALDRLSKYPDALDDIKDGLDGLIKNNPDNDGNYGRTEDIYNRIKDKSKDKGPGYTGDWPSDIEMEEGGNRDNTIQPRYVMKAGILARRRR